MAQNTFGRNITFPIYNADGTAFHGLELNKATVDSVVMSLGDKVTGDVYYIDNSLAVTMQEYIVVNSVKYTLVSPPTIVREGMVADNTQLKGMTKYSFTFYHPMYMLGNFPFTDIAVTQDEEKYLSQNNTFSWIGNLFEFAQKLNANLKNTQWAIDVEIPQYEQDGSTITPQWGKALKQSDVLSFDKNFISDALKTAYDTWEIPFVISHYESVPPSGYTRLKWVRISEIHQSVTNATAPFWLFIYNLNSVSADNKKIHYCKVFNEDTLLFDLIPCKDSNNNVGLYDVVEGVFYGSNQEVTFEAGGEIGKNKKFSITFGSPTNKIYDENGNEYVFRFGKGLGLKNNSRTPRNNKIVTRIVGYGSDRNVPYGYPQIPWTGNQSWDYTINNNPHAANSYPIYDGIVGGQRVRLIKHPFTRTTLMPSIYSETVNKKVNPNATGYDPDIEIKDYYDAIDDATHAYPNNINVLAPSVEVHQFEKEYPQLGEASIISATPYDEDGEYYTYTQWYNYLQTRIATMRGQGIDGWQMQLIVSMRDNTCHYTPETAESSPSASMPAGHWEWRTGQATATLDSVIKGNFVYVTLVSSWYNETHKILQIHADPTPEWDDTMNDDGEYIQSYFKIKLPQLTFDLYACAAVTQEMNINMRSGSCMGCTFPVQVDWELYKANFYDSNGNFAPDGAQRDLEKFPKSNLGSIDVIVKKDNDTFGTLMPNQYRYPVNGDKFVILGISLPTSYITTAEQSLDETMKEYMLENNVHYYDYPLKFDEHFLATHQNILAQIKNNNIVKFQYAGVQMALYIKQITIKYGDKPLPQYDITLTDDVEIVLNQIGQVTDDVSRMRVQVSELQKYYSENLIQEINSKLSKIVDDVCQGRITFQQGLDSLGSVIFHDKIQSPQFEEGLYTGRGWRIDNLGNAEFESARVRSFLEIVELIVNRLQAQEGDTLFTDNDQIEKVDVIEDETDHSISYILTLKEKYQGYVTGQMYGNVVKGVINTLAAKQAGVSDYESTSVEVDGSNKYYTSWMRVIGTHNTNVNLGVNQIQVVLYGDNFVPAGRNFAPCELMTIARWGCVDYSDPEDQDYESIKASIIRRQRMFMISTTDGRVVKYTGVDSPILKNGNYGVTIGELPEFVKNYPDVRAILNQVGEHTDWLYAQGIVVGNFIKVDIEGRPEVNIVDCGEWVDGSSTDNPTPRNGIYLYNEWNSTTQQYETHDVWHNNAKWRCLQHQPVIIGDVSTYYEPTDANSAYWRKLEQGSSGGETIMQYALSAYKTSSDGTAQTPPADISSLDWQDSPMATTSQKPYLWAKVQKKDGNGNNIGSPSYIRLTGEDGYTVEAQYAPNNNPTSSQIHTTWQDGDLYMRTKQSNETTWSSWHKIVGESGDETDYTFNISKSLTSSSATTAPANCYYNTWQDAPVSPTSTYPYLWMKIVKRTWNESTQSYDSGTAHYARVTGEKGGNAFVVDLENEMTNVALDENGNLMDNFDMYFKVRAYYGTTNVLSDSACSVSASCSDPDVTITDTNAKTTGIRVQISSGTHILDTTEVSVTVTHTTYGTRTVIFTLAGVCGGENAVLQELLPSLDAISFARTAAGGLTPSSRGLTLSIKKTQGGSTSTQSISDSGLSIRWSSTSMPASKTGGNGWGNGTATGISWNNNTMQIANTVAATNIYIAAFNSAGTLVDRETIPVIKDGANGTSPYFADLNNEMDAIQCKHDGSVIDDQTVSTVISMWKGSAVEAFVIDNIYRNGTQLTWSSNNNGVWPRVSGSTVSLEFTTSASIADIDDFKITIHSYNDNTVTRELHFTVNGVRANAIYRLVPSYSQIVKKKDGTYVPRGNITCSVEKTENGSASTPDASEYTLEKSVNGGSYTTYSATSPSSITSDLKFRLKVGGVVVDLETIPLVSDGDKGDPGSPGSTGARGKIGRFFYYAGAWNDFASTDSFLVNDAQAPYFYYNNNYWVFNPETNGTYTKQNMDTPSSSSSNWKLMTSDFKYIITEAIFGSYAHFGSFIINGDWMISQYGTINGSQSTSYTKFYPEFINGCSLCKSFDVSVSYVIAGSAYFIGGKKYYIKVIGSSFSSGSQLNVRMYNGSSNVGATLRLTSSSSSGTITFEPTTSGTYYLRADCQSSGMTAKLTSYVDDCFIPNFAINGLTGETYQQNTHVKGTIRANILYHSITEITLSLGNTQTVSDDCGDIIVAKLQWTSTYSIGYLKLPHASSMNGRLLKLYGAVLIQTSGGTAEIRISPQETNLFSYPDGLSMTGFDLLVGDSCELYSDGTKWYLLTISQCRA